MPPTRRRLPSLRQTSSNDCGAAALAIALAWHGKSVELSEVKSHMLITRGGASIGSILGAAQHYGLKARAIHADLDDLPLLQCGTILHWRFQHFVVLEGVGRTTITVSDPAVGRRRVALDTVRRHYTGVAIVSEPGATFVPGGVRRSALQGLRPWLRPLRERGVAIASFVALSILVQGLLTVPALLTRGLVDAVIPTGDRALLIFAAAAYCAVQVFVAIATFLRMAMSLYLRTRLEHEIVTSFLAHLASLPYLFFQQLTTGDVAARLGANNVIRETLTTSLVSFIVDGAAVAIYLGAAFLLDVQMTLGVLVLCALRVALHGFVRPRQRDLAAEAILIQSRIQTFQFEVLAAMETIKAMGVERETVSRWTNAVVDGLNLSIRRGELEAHFSGALVAINTASTLLLTFYGAYLVVEKSWSLGTSLAFAALAGSVLLPFNSLVSAVMQTQLLSVHLSRANEILDAHAETASAGRTAPISGAVALRNVSFRYGPKSPSVISDVSLSVPAGSRLAVVGKTGSGKSTLARVIARLYEPDSGSVEFDQVAASAWDVTALRRQIGFVAQETHLFGASIRDNLTMFEPNVAFESVVAAARAACIHDEVMSLPMGYETVLMDGGASLSGGQRQRLALARALVRSPKLLVLDEALSQVDVATEEQIGGNLRDLSCTVVSVTHRASAVRHCDEVAVMTRGAVVAKRPAVGDLTDADLIALLSETTVSQSASGQQTAV